MTKLVGFIFVLPLYFVSCGLFSELVFMAEYGQFGRTRTLKEGLKSTLSWSIFLPLLVGFALLLVVLFGLGLEMITG